MTAARRDARRDYRHFPPEYADLLRAFGRDNRADIGPMSERDARAAIRDLYRFKMFLTHACDSDEDDPYARELLQIFTAATLRVEPVVVVANKCVRPGQCADAGFGPEKCNTCNPDRFLVSLSLNPVVAAVRQMTHG